MILNLDQWHLGYASLLRDCRGPSSPGDDDGGGAGGGLPPTVGRALLLVHPDTDAMATARILSYMLRADGVPYQMRPCMGWSRLTKVLARVGVISKGNDEEEADGEEENGEGNDAAGNDGGEADADIRAVVLMNMGANRNLARLFRSRERDLTQPDSYDGAPRAGVKCYVFDCHRPYHLANVHAGKDVVLFNDRELEEDEVPSDGDNLSGDESSSDEESDSDEEDGGEGGGEGGPAGDDDEGEAEFELGDGLGEERFEESDPEEDNDGDDNDDNDGDSTTGPDSNEGKKLGGSGAAGLDTTAATADLTADETLDPSQTQEGEGTTTNTAEPALSFRELHRRRRNRIRLHYSAGSYHASPSSWAAYTLSRQLRFGDTPDLLWLACVGVTDAYLHGRLDVAGYSALAVDLRRHVGRLFPNELVDRAGRAVYAEELDGSSASAPAPRRRWDSARTAVSSSSPSSGSCSSATRACGTAWSTRTSSRAASRCGGGRGGRGSWSYWRRWASRSTRAGSRGRSRDRRLGGGLGRGSTSTPRGSETRDSPSPGTFWDANFTTNFFFFQEYGLGNCSYTGFVRVTGYKSLLSASDMSHAVTALLECSTEAMNGGSSPSAPGDGDMTEEDREDLEMVRNFNNALDAMNPNGSSSSVVPSSLAATAGGASRGGRPDQPRQRGGHGRVHGTRGRDTPRHDAPEADHEHGPGPRRAQRHHPPQPLPLRVPALHERGGEGAAALRSVPRLLPPARPDPPRAVPDGRAPRERQVDGAAVPPPGPPRREAQERHVHGRGVRAARGRGERRAESVRSELRDGREEHEGHVLVRQLRLERRGGRSGGRAEVHRAASLHDGERVKSGLILSRRSFLEGLAAASYDISRTLDGLFQ
ncbi:hypothetical protein THAOC_31757 [Thalassiosira oceanica]|uniref:Uncharacterized protein n=1 Tax=Thalassiosira oceanica TaxID=159749 RepID=K0RAM1_THAOC|nr:hypothetical protein THAOC_31757 [Thalassiosira oceanica]|eukprot:EJK49369.1 hypothetical protein THAOC_31757 [Thalassiosira oceanica]